MTMLRTTCLLFIVTGPLFFFSCQSAGPRARVVSTVSKLPESLQTQDEDHLRTLATEFDNFLSERMGRESRQTLVKSCETDVESNLFCTSILKKDEFDRQAKEARSPKPRKRARGRVYPKFKGNTVRNWKDLRFASISSTIGPVGRLKNEQLKDIVWLAKGEQACPNNIAVSAASALEDELQVEKDFETIAHLYVKGGDCLTAFATDRAELTTRGGLFYFLDGKYQEALKAFAISASVEGAVVSRALYWKYRTELALNRDSDAQKTLDELIQRYPFSFHSLIAQTTLNRDPGENLLASATADLKLRRSQQAPMVNLLLEQAETLSYFGLKRAANRVLQWAVAASDNAEPELKIYLAELQDENEDHLGKISLLSQLLYDNPRMISKQTMELYFPQPYFPIFEKNSAGLDPYLLLAIARQESAFDPKAVSSARARGLMQVLPRVGRRISKTKDAELFNPEINIEVGAKHIYEQIQRSDGQVHLALAAYNAGARKVTEWLARYPATEPILFIDLMPYRETRDYVGLVLRNYYWYRRINAGPESSPIIPSLSSRTEESNS